jgi:hypothetical protein
MTKQRFGALAVAIGVSCLVVAGARATDEPAGILWETTSRSEMEGMPFKMPAQTLKVCAAKEWTRPPAGGDKNCKTSDYQVVGSKATWTVQCTGEMDMTGAGEMTFEGTDSYTGIVKLTGDGMTMNIKLSGRKIGTCDKPQ